MREQHRTNAYLKRPTRISRHQPVSRETKIYVSQETNRRISRDQRVSQETNASLERPKDTSEISENRSLSRVPAGLRRDQGASQDALAGILRGAYLKIVSKPLEIRAGISTVNRPAPGISGYPSLNIRLGCLRDTRLSGGVSRVEMVSFT